MSTTSGLLILKHDISLPDVTSCDKWQILATIKPEFLLVDLRNLLL